MYEKAQKRQSQLCRCVYKSVENPVENVENCANSAGKLFEKVERVCYTETVLFWKE